MHDQTEKVVRQRTEEDGGQGEQVEEGEKHDMVDVSGDKEMSSIGNGGSEDRTNAWFVDPSSGMMRDRRVDEFMLGEIFHKIEEKYSKDMADMVRKLPEGVRGQVRDSMCIMLEGLKSVMTGVSDAVANEGHERRRDDSEMVSQIEELR